MARFGKIEQEAERRAKAAIADAMAQAENVVALADAKARQRIDEYHRRMQELARWSRDVAYRSEQGDEANDGRRSGDGAMRTDPHGCREAIAMTAYYKAERRSFAPGREVDDWLAAEKEVLARAPIDAPPGQSTFTPRSQIALDDN